MNSKKTSYVAKLVSTASALRICPTSGESPVSEPVSIDVVIPSIRADQDLLSNIVRMPVPQGVEVKYYIVVDRPSSAEDDPPLEFPSNVAVMQNPGNLGAHASRNRGFEAGKGAYILFLDDDIRPSPDLLESYKEAIEKHPDSVGFAGVAKFPPPMNSFTRGIVASDILTFWDIARTHSSLAWGVTANLMVKREAVGDIRFRTVFPKGGGGEDIDFCLRIVERTGKWLDAVPGAEISHPWWQEGRRSYRRFARWAYGDSRLPRLFPDHKYRNFPNMVETLVVGMLAWAVLSGLGFLSLLNLLYWIGLVVLFEFGAEAVRVRTRTRVSLLVAIEATLVRLSNDVGRILSNARRGHLSGLTERFDYFVTGESLPYERKIAASKFTLFVIAALAVYIM